VDIDFSKDEEIKNAVHMWLHIQWKTFFADGIRKLVDQSNNSCGEAKVLHQKVTKYLFMYLLKSKENNKLHFLNSPCRCQKQLLKQLYQSLLFLSCCIRGNYGCTT